MKAISPHFYQHDFSCPCGCGFADVSKELVALLESIHQHFEQPVQVQQGCCCADFNKSHGGEYASQHLLGTAADITVNAIAADVVADYLESTYPQKYGIGRSASYTHIDVRPVAARWRE
ncbi:D-Ala-D-Ala carboxypeptidase family metallohydrolase [Buttiauxella izardii]|uniref:Serine/threonine protein kinase n=1 Tax=Buttiauxella izardii TaxID=82991 RepID=A0A3A5JVI3_9ENTR|nr:D-Ala-D-Ala carboxypeptidase family metallohydrolase [Buttiauxella izardii]RJT26948.1 serine/threonine protein kinase [Buttiauxella izardii]